MHPWRSFPIAVLRYRDAAVIEQLARERCVDLVHASDVWKGDYAHHVAARLRVPRVIHVRGPISAHDVSKHHLTRAEAIVAIAERYHEDLVAMGVNPQKVEVIDDGVDIEYFRPGESMNNSFRRQFGLQGRVLIGMVGRIDMFKRVVEFLDVVAPLVRSMNGQVSVCVVGEPGPADYYHTVLRALERHKLTGRVILVGRWENTAEVLASLDILVTMSGGSVMFEAMASGKAVLSIRTDLRHSMHTRHGETALCVTTDLSEPATETLSRLIEDKSLRDRLGCSARTWVEQHLSVELMVERTQALYERLLDSSGADASC
jgi:glycosyltransferase involved in cell wall biosynthesis